MRKPRRLGGGSVVSDAAGEEKGAAPKEKDEEVQSEGSDREREYARELARKIQFLFDTHLREDGYPYSYIDLHNATNGVVSQSWLSRMLSGRMARPSVQIIEQLTRFFKVNPSFWFEPLDEAAQAQIKIDLGSPTLQHIAVRAAELNEAQQKVVLDMIDSLSRNDPTKKSST